MEYRRRNLWNDAVEEHVSYQLTGEMSSGGWLWNTFKKLMCCYRRTKPVYNHYDHSFECVEV